VKALDKDKCLPIHLVCKIKHNAPEKKVVLPVGDASSDPNSAENEKIVESLIDSYKDGVSSSDVKGRLPLHYAAENAESTDKVIKLLVDAFPKAVAVPDKSHLGNLPLHFVVNGEQDKMAINKLRILLESDKETAQEKNQEGNSALMIAERDGKLFFLTYLWGIVPPSQRIPFRSERGLFWRAMKHANSAIVLACLKKNPDLLDSNNKNGERPLQMAVRCGHKNIFELLLQQISKEKKNGSLHGRKQQ